jgi:hypothetical protein
VRSAGNREASITTSSKCNSRCVTVTYDDGVTVDLMPVVRIVDAPERVAELFHHKPETGESYRKEVNPKGFADLFNRSVGTSALFEERFNSRRFLVEGRTYVDLAVQDGSTVLAEADTVPMPAYVPLDQKSPRVVALQLLKRFRDKRYRKLDDHKGRRKPPSVMMAALALNAGPISDSLLEELLKVSGCIYTEIDACARNGKLIEVRNPAYEPDVFTDRWPESLAHQYLWANDILHLSRQLKELQRGGFDAASTSRILTDLFGENAARRAIDEHYSAKTELVKKGRLGVTPAGKVHASPGAPAIIGAGAGTTALVMPARANTNMGGCAIDADD